MIGISSRLAGSTWFSYINTTMEDRRGWRKVGTSETKDLTKLLLEWFDKRGNPLQLYKKYLASTVSLNVAHRNISILSDSLLEKFYMIDQPLVPPKYLDVLSSGSALAQLEACLEDERIVMLMPGSRKSQIFYKHFDKRVYELLERRDRKPTYFVLDRKGKHWELWRLYTRKAIKLYRPLYSESMFYNDVSDVYQADPCIIVAISKALSCTVRPHEHSPSCTTLADFVYSGDKQGIVNTVGSSFILASHLKSKPLIKQDLRRHPDNNTFGVHAVFGNASLESMPVVCVTEDCMYYKLKAVYASAVKRVQVRRRLPRQEPYPSPADSFSSKPGMASHTTPTDGIFTSSDTCKCAGCMNAPKYAANMSPNGGACLFRTDLSTFDLFKVLGKFSKQVEDDILRVCRYSTASYDCETISSQIPAAFEGHEDANFAPEAVSNQKLPRSYEAVHEVVLIGLMDELMLENKEEALIFTLDPNDPDKIIHDFAEAMFVRREIANAIKSDILAGYLAWLKQYENAHFNYFAEQKMLPKEFALANGYSVPEVDVLLDAWSEEVISELANDLSDLSSDDDDDDDDYDTEEEDVVIGGDVRGRKRKHDESDLGVVQTERVVDKTNARLVREIQKAWEFSIFGILQKRLRYLARCYTVFAFNASRFDSVLICGKLTTWAKQMGKRGVSIHKESSSIRHILIDGLRITDIRRLAPPNIDLSGLARMCNVREEKFIFPFEKLTNFEFLLSPSLPKDKDEWRNTLTPSKSPTQEMVNQAIAFFEEKQFTSVMSYLKYYLSLDVLLLQQSVTAIGVVYHQILGLHYLDSRKYTTSSLSSAGAQTFLARNRRPGVYFANHSRTYSVSEWVDGWVVRLNYPELFTF